MKPPPHSLVLNFPGITFGKPGAYWVRLTLNGLERAEVPFYVKRIKQPASE